MNENILDAKKEIGIVGLGKMGSGLALQLLEKGWKVVGYNRSNEITDRLAQKGLTPTYSIKELVETLSPQRIIWTMVPAGDPIEQVLFGEKSISKYTAPEDIIIDGGNSLFKKTIEREKQLSDMSLNFLDAGVSGGPDGARNGACIMVGGNREIYQKVEGLFSDLCVENGYGYMGPTGAGHFVKMVHNGIEYGMMQAIAEGFDIMRSMSDFNLNLTDIAKVYNNGSVIESRLIGWLHNELVKSGNTLEGISGAAGEGGGKAGQSGKSEGAWTAEVAKEIGVPAEVIKDAVEARTKSRENPSFQGKIINALRGQFGGHGTKE